MHNVLPAAAVRGPKHVVTKGATPVLTPAETRSLLDGIDAESLVGLRDRALLSVMVYSFARVSAVVWMRRQDYFLQGTGPGVVGGQRENGPELVGEAAQVGDAGVDVLPGVESVGDAEVALRVRHQLHQALGSGGRLRGCAVPGLDGDDGVHQVGVDAVPLGGCGDDAGERPRAGLGQAREDAGGDGDEQQEYEATAGETRRRHGERARYHMRGAGR